jgi:hypothetical protein
VRRGGNQLREYKVLSAPCYPVESPIATRQPVQHGLHLEPALCPEIAGLARHESLRELAAEYGVSHEAIRFVLRRKAASGHQFPAA